jgi:hypothetical protein
MKVRIAIIRGTREGILIVDGKRISCGRLDEDGEFIDTGDNQKKQERGGR